MAQETAVQRLERVLGAGAVPRAPRTIETSAAASRRRLAMGLPQGPFAPGVPPEVPEEPSLGDKIVARGVQGLGRYFTSNLNPLNMLSLAGRFSASSARELTDLLDSDSSNKASFGDFFKQAFDTSYGYGTAFPMKGWKGRIVGFAGDVLLDPTTYVTFGGTAVVKGTGMAARAGARALARAVAKEVTADAATTMGRAATRKLARQAYKQAYQEAVADFGTQGGRAVLGKQVIGREGRQKLAQAVDGLLQEQGADLATRQTIVREVASRGKSALYDSSDGMRILNRLGVSGPGLYYFGSRVKVPGSDVIGKMLEKGVTKTRLGVSRSAPVSRLLRSFVPEGTGRLANFGPDTLAEVRFGLQTGKPIMVGGQEIDPVLGIKMLEWDDLRRIGVAEATENWDDVATGLVNAISRWEAKYGARVHTFFDGRDYIQPGFTNVQRLAAIEAASPGATAELEALYGQYKEFMAVVKTQIDAEAAGTGRQIGKIEDGYVPRMLTPEAQEWMAKFGSDELEDLSPSRYAGSLQSRELREGRKWFGHELTTEDLTIDRLNELAARPTPEWLAAKREQFAAKKAATGSTDLTEKFHPVLGDFFRTETPDIFIDYIRAMAEQVGTFRMAKGMLSDPNYARALEDITPTPAGVQRVAEEAAEAAGRYQQALAEYHKTVGALRVALDRSFDVVASRVVADLADDAGTRSTVELVASHIEAGALAADLVDDVSDAVDSAIAKATEQAEKLDVARADFEPYLQDDAGLVEGNYRHIAEQLEQLKAEFAAIQAVHAKGRAARIGPQPGLLAQRNAILADVLKRLEAYSEKVDSVILDIGRWSSVEDLVPRLDAIDPVDADSFYRLLLRNLKPELRPVAVPNAPEGFTPFSLAQYAKRRLTEPPMRRQKIKGGTGKWQPRDARKPAGLTDDQWAGLKTRYAVLGKRLRKSVARVSTYERARYRISAALQIIAEGRTLNEKQVAALSEVLDFSVYKYAHAEMSRAIDTPTARTIRTVFDDFVQHDFTLRFGGDSRLRTGEHGWLATLMEQLGKGVDGAVLLDVPTLYRLQDFLHYAASTEQLWEINVSLQQMGIEVGDDVIAQVLLHNSDTYVVDALRLRDAARLEQLRPTDSPTALPYGRIPGARGLRDPFGASFVEEVPISVDELTERVLGEAGPALERTTAVPRSEWPEGAVEVERVLRARQKRASEEIALAQADILDLASSIRGNGFYSRARVRVQTPELTDKAVSFLRKKLRGDLKELIFMRRFGVRQYLEPLRLHMSSLGYTLDESNKVLDDWFAQYGGRFEQLVDLFLRARSQAELPAERGVFQYYERDFETIAYWLGGQEPRVLRERWLTESAADPAEVEAILVTVLRGIFEDSARFVDDEYSILLGELEIRQVKALARLQQANSQLEGLVANPFGALYYLSDEGDAVAPSALLPGLERKGVRDFEVADDPGTKAGEIQIEIEALEASDEFVLAKSAENHFAVARQLARINIPEGQTFLGFTQDTLDDFLAGAKGRGEGAAFTRIGLSDDTYRAAANPTSNPTGSLEGYVRLNVEQWLAAGNIADAEVIGRRLEMLQGMWESSRSYAYLDRIRQLRAEKFAVVADDLSLLDDVDVLLRKLEKQQLRRLKQFDEIRAWTRIAYTRLDEYALRTSGGSAVDGEGTASSIISRLEDLDPEISPEKAARAAAAEMQAGVNQSALSEMIRLGGFNILDPEKQVVDVVEQELFESAAQRIVWSARLNYEELENLYSYIRLSNPTDATEASEMLTHIDYVLEMIKKVRQLGGEPPAFVKEIGGYSSMSRRLRAKSVELDAAFPAARSAHKPGTVRLYTGEAKAAPSVAPRIFTFDYTGSHEENLDRARKLAQQILQDSNSPEEFIVKGFQDPELSVYLAPVAGVGVSPEELEILVSRAFVRELAPEGRAADRRVGYYLKSYDQETGTAVFRSFDADADEIIPTTERFDASVGAGGRMERAPSQEASATSYREPPREYIDPRDEVNMDPLPVSLTETVQRSRTQPGVARPAGVTPERTFNSLDELRRVLGIEDVPTETPAPRPPASVKTGYPTAGRGTPAGDAKDVAMRDVADSAIVELDPRSTRPSSSRTTQESLGLPGSDSRVVMLARNGSLRDTPLNQETIDLIEQAHRNGARFVVGDMPGVDEPFIRLLERIGADYDVYVSGARPRVSLLASDVASVLPPAPAAAPTPTIPPPALPTPTPVAAYDQAEAIIQPTILSDVEKARQGKERLDWLLTQIPDDASPQWRAAFTNFVDRATVWLEQVSEGGKLDPAIEALLGSHLQAEIAFMEAAAELGEEGTDRAMFASMADLINASTRPRDKRYKAAVKAVERAVEEHFPKGWEQLHNEFFPNIVVSDQLKALWQRADFRRDPDWMKNGIIETIQEFTKFHKAYAVMTPGFHVRNAIGNAFTLFFAGANMRNVARGVELYTRMQRHLATGAPIEIFFDTLTAEERAVMATAREAMFASGGGIFSATYREAEGGGRFARFYDNPLTKFNYDVGQASDNAVRFAMGFDVISRGGDRNAAQVAIKRFFFDYEDLSKADKYIKEIIPFWLWSSRNFVSQIQNIFINPKRYLAYTKLRNNLRSDDERKTEKNLPFVAELGGFELPVGKDYYFVPDIGVMRALQMPKEYTSYRLVNSFTPWARVPIELVANRKSFTNKPVYGDMSDIPKDTPLYLLQSFLPPVNQATRIGVPGVGDGVNKNSLASFLGIPVRNYGN